MRSRKQLNIVLLAVVIALALLLGLLVVSDRAAAVTRRDASARARLDAQLLNDELHRLLEQVTELDARADCLDARNQAFLDRINLATDTILASERPRGGAAHAAAKVSLCQTAQTVAGQP